MRELHTREAEKLANKIHHPYDHLPEIFHQRQPWKQHCVTRPIVSATWVTSQSGLHWFRTWHGLPISHFLEILKTIATLTFSPNLPFSLILIKSPHKQVSYLRAAWFNFLFFFFFLPLMFLATLTLRELLVLYIMPPLTHIQFPFVGEQNSTTSNLTWGLI